MALFLYKPVRYEDFEIKSMLFQHSLQRILHSLFKRLILCK